MSIIRNLAIIMIMVLSIQCSKENKFLIEKGKVGVITNETVVQDIDVLFDSDSIVSKYPDTTANGSLLQSNGALGVYSKSGVKLLEIVPESSDSLSKISSVQIFDKNYKTDKGLSLNSTFKDINENYLVNNIETTLTSATLFIDELNATIAIDKKELCLNTFSREEI